jgi:CRISPR system Cascade subunit CasE
MFFSEVIRNDKKELRPNENTYENHQFIWKLFGKPGSDRDFLFTLYNNRFYVVSSRVPNFESSNIQVRTKNYDSEFKEGEFLRFDVRLDVETRIGRKRMSIVSAYKKRFEEGHRLKNDEAMHEAFAEWFQKHSHKYGFKIRNFYIQGYDHYNFVKTETKEKVEFDSLDIRGVLEVKGPAVFSETLLRGFGKAKCFGCGLMLVAR